MSPPSRGADRPSFAQTFSPKEGAGNAGCTLHPRSRVQCAQRNAHTSIQVKRRHPASPAQWLYGLWRALPGDEFVLSPSSADLRFCETRLGPQNLHRLDTSNGCQDHTLLPYAATRLSREASPDIGAVVLRGRYRSREIPPCNSVSRRRCRVHRIPGPRSVTMANAPLPGPGWGELVPLICPTAQAIFRIFRIIRRSCVPAGVEFVSSDCAGGISVAFGAARRRRFLTRLARLTGARSSRQA